MSMNTSAASADRLRELSKIELEITSILEYASSVLAEMGKEKPNTKIIEASTENFNKAIESVETKLNEHILYLTKSATGRSYECSSYGALKDSALAAERMQYLQGRLGELQKLRREHAQLASATPQWDPAHRPSPRPSPGPRARTPAPPVPTQAVQAPHS